MSNLGQAGLFPSLRPVSVRNFLWPC